MTRENELLQKIEKGDASCWEELAAMYYDDILRYCLYHTRDRETAEDAVQETFLKVIRYFPRYKNKGKFRAFLYKVASNTCGHVEAEQGNASDGTDRISGGRVCVF